MPRIRTIKPEYWTDPVMVQLSPLARLFYIGTWNFAMCDQGHLEDDPMRLKLQILPAENVDVQDLIDELTAAGRLHRIDTGNDSFLHVKTLADHQKVDGRWTPRCPACAHQNSPSLTETPRASPKHTTVKESKGKERKGRVADATPRPEVEALCGHLADLVESNGSKRPNITKAWLDAARLLIDNDKRDPREAWTLIEWSQASPFWQANVMSMPKFREKYDTLRLQSGRDNAKPGPRAANDARPEGW